MPTRAVIPAASDGTVAGAATNGQNCKHPAVQTDCPGRSAVNTYTVRPRRSASTTPSRVRTVSSTAGAEARCGGAAAAVMIGAGAVVCAGTARALLHAVVIKGGRGDQPADRQGAPAARSSGLTV